MRTIQIQSGALQCIEAGFIFLFVYTAVSKLTNLAPFVATMNRMPVIMNYAKEISIVVPMLELLVAGLLIVPVTKRAGLYASLTLMILFTMYIAVMMATMPDLPCSCGGVVSQMSWKGHLALNAALCLLAAGGIVLDRHLRKNGRQRFNHTPHAKNIIAQ